MFDRPLRSTQQKHRYWGNLGISDDHRALRQQYQLVQSDKNFRSCEMFSKIYDIVYFRTEKKFLNAP